jgi:hypothetical protein
MNVDSQYSEQLNKKHFDFLHCVYKATDFNIYIREIFLLLILLSL